MDDDTTYRPLISFRHPDGNPAWKIDSWTRLTFFQNAQLLAERYEARHQVELSASKSVTIASHIAQGKDYFASAVTAGTLARPLLVYYGVLALSRALIMFLTKSDAVTSPPGQPLREFQPAHGLHAEGWDAALQVEPSDLNLVDLRVRAGGTGTFIELVSSIRNIEWTMVKWVHPNELDREIPHSYGYLGWNKMLPLLPTPWTFTFGEVVSRLPDLAVLFEEAFRRSGGSLPCEVVVEREPFSLGRDVSPHARTVSVRVYRNELPLPETGFNLTQYGITLPELDSPLGDDRQVVTFLKRPTRGDEVDALIPHLRFNSRMGTYIVPPWPDGSRLAILPTLFAASYCLGMLVRYHPTAWHYATSVQYGNRALPIIQETMRLVLDQFPLEVVELMERKEIPVGEIKLLPAGLNF